MFQFCLCKEHKCKTLPFCNHLASLTCFQRGEELCAVSCISIVIISSVLITVRYFCVRGEKLVAFHDPGCGYDAVPLGWDRFISVRLRLACGTRGVKRGRSCCLPSLRQFALKPNRDSLISASLTTKKYQLFRGTICGYGILQHFILSRIITFILRMFVKC